MLLVQGYLIYIAASILITVWVGHTLHKNGRIFLVENFGGKETLADSVNHLLLVGFYLINFGFVSLALQYGVKPDDVAQLIEFLSNKIGLVIIVLGAMHFTNMYVVVKFRNRKIQRPEAPTAIKVNVNNSSPFEEA